MRVVFLSPAFPAEMTKFTRGLAEVGATVLGVGDTPRESLPASVKPYLTDYLTVPRMLDEQEFLAGNGVRSLSRRHLAAPYQYHAAEASFGAAYVTGESDSDMFGGSSN